jgi:two-component system, OmpR family, phosphate regulon sensor histidine kinase PhoR
VKEINLNSKRINLVVLFGILSLASILLIQVAWIEKSIDIQHKNIAIYEKEESLNLKQFSENTHIALNKVLQEITSHNQFPTDTYGSVKQVRTNYFTVDVSEEIHPYYLESLLKHAFYDQNVLQDFQYGIYDCFSDSIVFGKLIKFDKDFHYSQTRDTLLERATAKLKEKTDSHYFTVYFPNVSPNSLQVQAVSYSPWMFVVTIIVVVGLFFGYAISVITKQKRLSEIKNDFINNMTHELKTPISTISLSSEMLIKTDFTNDPERLKKYAGIIYKENKRLENQVERVLNVAKLDKQKLMLQKVDIHIHDLILEAKEIFEFNQLEREGTIELELNAPNSVIQADQVHITNVVYNLLDNAIKYCEDTPSIKIRTSNLKNGIAIEMQDNGIGIKKEDQKLIFDKFYRVPTGNLHNVKGFGLGLYYVKLIIEEHGGTVKLKSAAGAGTTFIIWLPVS